MKPKPLNILGKWDWLVILDACRYDFFKELWKKSQVEARISYGSCTVEFLHKMPPIPNSILVSGHPFPLKRKDKFTTVVDVGFDYNLNTSPPHFITNYVRNNLKRLLVYRRRVLWFLQPHHPYIGETKLNVPIYEDVKNRRMSPERNTIRRLINAKRRGILEKAYRDNLILVLKELEKILPLMKGTVVITADHGEGLGKPLRPQDQPVFSHPCNRWEWEVRLVPYTVINIA